MCHWWSPKLGFFHLILVCSGSTFTTCSSFECLNEISTSSLFLPCCWQSITLSAKLLLLIKRRKEHCKLSTSSFRPLHLLNDKYREWLYFFPPQKKVNCFLSIFCKICNKVHHVLMLKGKFFACHFLLIFKWCGDLKEIWNELPLIPLCFIFVWQVGWPFIKTAHLCISRKEGNALIKLC